MMKELVWCQEEPLNQGFWDFLDRRLNKIIKEFDQVKLHVVGRKRAAAPAVGYASLHNKQQLQIC